MNKPGTVQVGVISKAQKYSKNNYCKIFQVSHSVEEYPKGFLPRNSKTAFSLNWRRQKKLICNNRKFQKIMGVTFDIIQKFSEKSRIVPKKTKGGPLAPLYFWKHKKYLWFCARLEPTLIFFSDPRKLVGREVEQMNKNSGPIALN